MDHPLSPPLRTSPPEPNTTKSLFQKRKDAILAKSMAVLAQSLGQWFDKTVSTLPPPASAVGGRKRAREDTPPATPDKSVGTSQKRTKREPPNDGRTFACPFFKHDPARFRKVKTCCGPGWKDIHRVKEHVYRSHLRKHRCNRCGESFGDAKGLREHQRGDRMCEKREDGEGEEGMWITEEQEEKLRARAKAGSSAEGNWRAMYAVIFPGEGLASPYYDSLPTDTKPATPRTSPSTTSTPKPVEETDDEPPRFTTLEDYKFHFTNEVLKAVKPLLAIEVDKALKVVEANVVEKAADFVNQFQIKLFRTAAFQSEQAELLLETSSVPERGPGTGLGGGGLDFSGVIEGLMEDPASVTAGFMLPEGGFNWEPWMGVVGWTLVV